MLTKKALKRVYQKDTSRNRGDCLRASICTLLGRRIMPNFKCGKDGVVKRYPMRAATTWLQNKGYVVVEILNARYVSQRSTIGTLCVVAVPSEFHKDTPHAVVAEVGPDNKFLLRFDPNPKSTREAYSEIKHILRVWFIFKPV